MPDPLYLFVFAGLFSPGPNVILLTASGARFGFGRTIPHILGVALGVGVTAGLTGLGIGALLLAAPSLTLTLKAVAAAWILYMAYRLYRGGRGQGTGRMRPFTMVEAILFQWVNPKVWAVAIAASAGYPAGLDPLNEGLRLGLVFSSLNLAVCLFWVWAGTLLAYLLTSVTAWRMFSALMAAALAASAAMVFL
ncbi:LysE family translocator [Brevirhabdus sp.]|uniref:LysE family translocator n=1 Tax=Brevirhabdus sp. TaxID=2004514 RepID=UPI0040581FAE